MVTPILSPGLESLDQRLLESVLQKDAPSVELLIKQNANPNSICCNNNPLFSAVEKADKLITKLLLDAGANPNVSVKIGIKGRSEQTPLEKAVENVDFDISKLLIEAKADINSKTSQCPPLLRAVLDNEEEMVKLLLENGGEADFATPFKFRNDMSRKGGLSLLWIAIKNERYSIARALLEHGAEPDWIPGEKDHVLKICLDRGETDMARLLLEKGALGWPFCEDGEYGDSDYGAGDNLFKFNSIVKSMIDKNEINDLFWDYSQKIFISTEVICCFIGEGRFDIARKLFSDGRGSSETYETNREKIEYIPSSRVTGIDSKKRMVYHRKFIESVLNNDVEEVEKILVNYKISLVDLQYTFGCSIFELLDFTENNEIKQKLDNKIKAEIGRKFCRDSTWLTSAVSRLLELRPKNPSSLSKLSSSRQAMISRKMKEIESLLIHEANPNISDEKGLSVLNYAAKKFDNELASLLIKYGADIQVAIKNIEKKPNSEEAVIFLNNLIGAKTKRANVN